MTQDKLESAWERLGINERTVRACEQASVCAVHESAEVYWRRCRDYLASIENLPYECLSHKQRNWIASIKSDLNKERLL